ncbi:MAG: DEAD/DEAH box helicase [Candidatus Wildermuthbacteria bacterium]|nr:DEAD/DEAH box helicase [Candidatus Wildermuthbacteria bacterium]
MEERTQNAKTGDFYGLGIAPVLLEIVKKLHFTTPTPIQVKAIPIACEGKDVVGIAQTGTGKTLAFGIPMIQRLMQIKKRGLVVLPTRELAIQVDESLRRVGNSLGLKTAVLIGGTSIRPQITALMRRPHIIIATPGRLIDHLQQRTVRLDDVAIAVLDEADRMLDMGFFPQIQTILQALPKDRQTMLFSATMPSEIMRLAASYMKLPVRIEVAPTGTTVEKVTQELFIVERAQKIALLAKLLETYRGPAIVFARTKHGASKIMKQIRSLGVNASDIHSNKSLSQRKEALEGFKSGKYRVLVATDIASRGIDVIGIELVVNYDLPSTSGDYVHRIGRTARAGAKGHAITFALPNEYREIRDIERLIRKPLPVSRLPELPHITLPSEPFRPAWRPQKRAWGHAGSRFQNRRANSRVRSR